MSQPTAPIPAPPRTLQRSATDRKLFGVCGGFAAHYGIDPLIVRIAVVVLALFGGLGIVLYLAGAAAMPEPGDTSDLLSSRRLPMLIVAVIAAIVILPNIVFPFGDGAGFLVTVGLIVLIIVLARRPASTPPSSVAPEHTQPVPQPTEAAQMTDADASAFPESGGYAETPYPEQLPDLRAQTTQTYPTQTYPAQTYPAPPYPAPPYVGQPVPPATYPVAPKPPRARSYLGALTLSVSLIWFGVAWALNAADVTAMSAVTIFGVSLAILGVGVLIGAWIGRARWLVLLALPLSLVLWGLSAVPDEVRLGEAVDWASAGFGETSFAPEEVTDRSFDWGFGSAALDVGDWDAYAEESPFAVDAEVGVGELVITVPDTWNAVINAEVGLGSIRAEGAQVADGGGLQEVLTFESQVSGAPLMRIDASVDLGEIRIVTTDESPLNPAITPEESA